MKLMVKCVAAVALVLIVAKCVLTLLDDVCVIRHYTTVE